MCFILGLFHLSKLLVTDDNHEISRIKLSGLRETRCRLLCELQYCSESPADYKTLTPTNKAGRSHLPSGPAMPPLLGT